MMRTLRLNDELQAIGSDSACFQVIEPTLRRGWIKLFDYQAHEEVYKDLAEINRAIVDGRLVLKRKSAPRTLSSVPDDPEQERRLRHAMRCVREVEQFRRRFDISFASAYAMAKEEHTRSAGTVEAFPSRATLYRYLCAKRNDLPLLRGNRNKGNRTARYSDAVVFMVCDLARKLLLKEGSRWTIRSLTAAVNDYAEANGLVVSGARISRDFVRKVIHQHLSVDPQIERMNPKLVPAAKSIAKHCIVVSTPFERVEQDALHLPFSVQTPYGVSSDVWLVHAIDCCTGKVVGWHLDVGAPNESRGLKCVESTLFSKRPVFERLGLAYDDDIYGKPYLLVFDNGPEARGRRMGKLVKLHIDSMHCKSRHAQGKPFIERLNRSLKEALETLPGCTRHDGQDGMRDPVALGDPLMSLEELERWIVRWYFEDWGNTKLERHTRSDLHESTKLGNTPNARWLCMTQELGYAMPLSPTRTAWLSTLLDRDSKMLSRKTGVTYRSFHYRGENLAYLIGKYGEVRVNFLFDPDDFRQILVEDGEGMPLVPLIEKFSDETTPAYSFDQMHALRRDSREAEVEDPAKKAFRREMLNRSIAATAKPPKKTMRRAEANRAVSESGRSARALQKAIERPLPSARATRADGEFQTFDFDEVEPLPVLSRKGEKEAR